MADLFLGRPRSRRYPKFNIRRDIPKAHLVRLSRQRKQHRKIPSSIDGSYAGQQQSLVLGSYIQFEREVPAPIYPSFSVKIRPTKPARGVDQAIMCWNLESGIFVNGKGHLEFRWAGTKITSEIPLNAFRWYEISCWIDASSNEIVLVYYDIESGEKSRSNKPIEQVTDSNAQGTKFGIAACLKDDVATAAFDGKIEQPRIKAADDKVIANWDFSIGPKSNKVSDISPNGLHGTIVNHPQRAVTGHNWSGKQMHFQYAPEEYGAISFHSDDLTDAKWETSFELEIPADLPSGIYGIELEVEDGYDCVPFVVRPAVGERTSRALFLVPTFSYLAYANDRHWWHVPGLEEITGAPLDDILSEADRWAHEQKLLSVYDFHADGTGCCHASYLRPLVSMRPEYRQPVLDGPHQISADLYLTDWLASEDQLVDVITDHDLHREGIDAINEYNVIITGTHPEYVSEAMIDCIADYTRNGGHVMYLGGNGFYAVTSVFEASPDVMEVRRGRYGIIPWYSEPGEHYHAATGEQGGQWRLRGRDPQQLLGVGMAGFSFGQAAPYKRTPESKSSAYAWVFEGCDADTVDANGDVMGGPAGFEFDRIEYSLGSPHSTVCLATATDFNEFAVPLPDDTLGTGYFGKMQADISYLETPGKGAVFSTGSVTWCTCLFDNNGNNDVARITLNVLKRFQDDLNN